MLLNLSTAPRPGATLDLTWDRIDAETGVVNYVVPGRKLTKKRRAKAPLCGPAIAYLEGHRSVGPVIQWRGRQLKGHKMTFSRIADRAKVDGTAYGIRKAVSIWLRKEGVHEWDVKGMLGHAIGGETERYAHYRPEYMRAAAASVERLLIEISPRWLANHLPVVGGTRFELVTPCMSSKCSTAELTAPSVLPVTFQLPAVLHMESTAYVQDHFHVKDGVVQGFQHLKASNDD